ncbi:MAG: adenylate/guanylate cyclase domain-containing protein [Bacteroidota bacterium]
MADKDFTILYVDDEVDNLRVFKAAFRRKYKIELASSAEEGIRILKEKPIDLIITDQRMPEITGVEFLKKVVPLYPDTVRMVLTGYSDLSAIVEAINLGQIYRYIGKPWDEEELNVAIENARQLSRLKKKNRELLAELQHKMEIQEKTLQTFKRFVPPKVVEECLSTAPTTIFEGEQRHLTVLFCDLRGFTSISEKWHPTQVVSFLNDYYESMTDAVEKYGGVVMQYIGDEVFAVFGAPISISDHELKAVTAALEMREQMEKVNTKYRETLGFDLSIGIGVNSGEVVAGTLGTHSRLSYSVAGDVVNTGKRIESVTKSSPNQILVHESVYEKVKETFSSRALDPVYVKGKEQALNLYEILK